MGDLKERVDTQKKRSLLRLTIITHSARLHMCGVTKKKKIYLGDDCAPKHNANISTFGKTITKTAIVRLTRMVMHEIKFALNFTS